MDAMLNRIADYLLAQSWQIALLVAVIALISWTLRHRSAHVRYLLWLIVLAKCLVPPVVNVSVPVLPEPTAQTTLPAQTKPQIGLPASVSVETPRPLPTITSDPAPTRPELSTRQWLAIGWLAGMGLFALTAPIKASGTALWLRRQRQPMPKDVRGTVERLLSSLGVKRLPRMWLIEGIGQPFVWGLAPGDIYLPSSFLKLTSDEHRRSVLAHEIGHVLRLDAAVNTLQIVAQALFWFHPLVWWANKRLRAEREKCCDEMAIAHLGTQAREYSTAIVNTLIQEQASIHAVPSLAIAGPAKNIEERIRTMLRPGKKFYKRPSLIAATIVLLAALLMVPTALVLTARAQTEPPEAKANSPQTLHQAAAAGDLEQVKKSIADGADVNATEGDAKSTPLHAAASEGHAQIVKALLEAGAKVDTGDSHGCTPLYYAIWSDDEETVRALVSADADVNKGPTNEGDYPPLIYAIWTTHKGNVEILLDAGADINTTDEKGYTPLYWAGFTSTKDVFDLILTRKDWPDSVHLAACKGQLKKVTALMENGANVNAKDEFGCTPLHWAALADTNDVADFLLAQGADVNARDNMSFTPLMAAHRLGMVGLLTSKGAGVNAKVATHGRTRLHISCYAGEKDIAELLIAKGADVDARDKGGMTPLRLAAGSGQKDIVELLLKAGADANARDNQGRTPLSVAMQRNHTKVVNVLQQHGAKESLHHVTAASDIDQVKRLISEGAEVNKTDGKGQTPLHLAVLAGRKDIVELLIAEGANINAKSNTWDTTPLIAALRSGQEDIAKLLIAKGADVRATGRGNYTPLHCAAMNRARMTGVLETMTLLLAKGADIDARQEHDATPLACATYDGNTESTTFLIEHGANIEATLNDGETTPLLRAVSQQHMETARVLLNKGANIHATWRGLSAIDNAMLGDRLSNRKGDPEMVKLLMEKGLQCPSTHLAAFSGDLQKLKDLLNDGARTGEQDAAGFTPLHCAVCGDHMDIVKFLLGQGANVNARSKNGWAPLAFVWPVDMAALLIANGADVRIADERGQTSLHGAVNRNNHRGDKALVELLLKHGADVNARAASTSVGWAGWTPFHVACRNGNPEIVELLLAHGANISAKTDKRETPMAVAQSNGQGQIVNLLRRHGAEE